VRSVAPPSEFELQSLPADEPLQGRDPRKRAKGIPTLRWQNETNALKYRPKKLAE
jgi:hypothetical protein